MTIDLAVTIGGSVVLAVISALIGASMDSKGQRRSARAVALKRQELREERLKLERERRRLVQQRARKLALRKCPGCGRRL